MHKLFFCGVLLAAFGIVASGENPVVNGDFEKGIKPWTPYRGNWKEPFAVPKIVPCDEPGHGSSAVAVEAKEGVRAAGVSCEVKLPEKSRHFRISLWLKVVDIKDGWVQMVLQRRVDGPDGKRKMVRLWTASTPPTHRGGGKIPWTEFCGEFTLPDDLPPGRDFLVMRLGGANVSGEAWFDNVVIEPTSSWEEQAAQARQNARPSGVNLLRDWWRFRTAEGFVPIRQEGKNFTADIPAGKKAVWTDTVFSVHDNIQGPMRFSFQSRHRINAVLRCSLFPTEQKNDVVHTAKPVGKPDADGFQTYAVEFTPLPHTGRMAVTLTAGRKDKATKMEFRNICLERLVPVEGGVSLYKARHGEMQGIFRKSEAPRTDFQFENASTREHKVSVKVVLADFYGRKVFETARDFTLPPQSITPCQVEYPRLELPGFYSVAAEWRSEESDGRYRGGFVTVEEPLKDPDRTFSFSPWEGDIAWRNVEAQALLGCGLKGITFFGRFVQDSDFAPVERSVAACEARGLTVVGTLVMPSGRFLPKFKPDPEKLKRGEFPYDDDYFQETTKRITELAKRYRGRIKYWILYDELDCSVLRYSYAIEHYIRLTKAVCEAFRAVDPDVVITGITVTGHDNKAVPRYPILHQVWPQLKNHLDGLALDAYSAGNTFGPNWTSKDPVSGEFREIVRAAYEISSADGRNHLCIHERGYAHSADLPVDGDYEIARARAYAADFVLTKTMPEVEFVLFFNWRTGNDGPSRQFGFMVHENATPSAAAFAAAARRLAHVKYLHQIRLPHNALQCFVFRRGDTTVVPLWISAEPTDFKIRAEFRCPAVAGLQAFDLQGNPVRFKLDGGEMVLPLSASPLYLETAAAPETVEAALRQGRCQLPELALDLTLARGDTVRGCVKNLTGKPLQAKLNLTAGSLRSEKTAVSVSQTAHARRGRGAGTDLQRRKIAGRRNHPGGFPYGGAARSAAAGAAAGRAVFGQTPAADRPEGGGRRRLL